MTESLGGSYKVEGVGQLPTISQPPDKSPKHLQTKGSPLKLPKSDRCPSLAIFLSYYIINVLLMTCYS